MTSHSKPRYTTEMSIKEARDFVKYHFGKDARIPWGSRCMWVSGVHYVTDQPGIYLVAGSGGMNGVHVIPAAASGQEAA